MGVLYNRTDANIQLQPDDFNELKQRVFNQFGWPTISVEISDDSFKYILKRGISFLNTYSPREVLVSRRSDHMLLNMRCLIFLKLTECWMFLFQ